MVGVHKSLLAVNSITKDIPCTHVLLCTFDVLWSSIQISLKEETKDSYLHYDVTNLYRYTLKKSLYGT